MAEVLFSLQLPFKITKRAKWFLATCPILDVHSQGETEKKAKENLVEALSLFFISCFERRTLDAVLKKYNSLQHANSRNVEKPLF